MDNSLVIKKSKIQGKGVFSRKIIKKGDKIFTFSDRKIEINHSSACNCKICHRCIQVGNHLWLYPKKGSYGWNINHSCNPNSGIKGKVIIAIKRISPNDEITLDYSTTTSDADWKINCNCKSKTCRKIIRGVQFLPRSLREKYKGLTSINP